MGAKYIEKLVQLLGLQSRKARATPELAPEGESAAELEGERRSSYATAVGILLYISPHRPDAQHCIRELASQLVKPTEKHYRQLEHLSNCQRSHVVQACYIPMVKMTIDRTITCWRYSLTLTQIGVATEPRAKACQWHTCTGMVH